MVNDTRTACISKGSKAGMCSAGVREPEPYFECEGGSCVRSDRGASLATCKSVCFGEEKRNGSLMV
jgi:hypothetical protein